VIVDKLKYVAVTDDRKKGAKRVRKRKFLRMRSRDFRRSYPRLALVLALALAGLLVGVLRSAHGSEPAKPLLPNLVADPPDNISLASESEGVEGGHSGTQLLLRFNGYVHNIGPGALDIRGSREKPKLSKQTEKEVEIAEENKEPLHSPSQKTEEELATPPMKVSQRLFLPIEGMSEKERRREEANVERPAHVEEASAGEMIYVNADGHHHWHLQKVARYSLWNATKTAEVAPAQKVGFCLDDSQHVELSKGPETRAYSDNVAPYREFCQQYHPDATSVYEGISPGWRDLYEHDLAFQWVNASDVLPGEYWLREDVNPLGVVKEEPGANEPAYATTATIIPGFDALAQATSTQVGQAMKVTLTAKAWRGEENGQKEEALPTPIYTVLEAPKHGRLTAVVGNQLTYTPEAGYSGSDSFVFSAADPNSPFPTSPAQATVSIAVGEAPQPSVSIGGAPSSMIAGTSVALTATVANDEGGVEWTASDGTFTAEGAAGLSDDYVAPSEVPPGAQVTLTARLEDNHAVSDQRTIVIVPVPEPVPAPQAQPPAQAAAPGVGGPGQTPSSSPPVVAPVARTALPPISRPRVMLIGRKLIMTTYVNKAGHARLSAYLGSRKLGTCATTTPAKRTFTCRLTLGSGVSAQAHISVWASLRIGSRIVQNLRPAAEVAQMKMAHSSGLADDEGISGASWCSPSSANI
jgi:Lysyl oxidase/Bacterial Ig domain